MSTMTTRSARLTSRPSPVPTRPPGRKHAPSVPACASRSRGGTVLFQVGFASAMGDCDLALLARALDLWTHMTPKMRPDPTSPGVARLDHFSGLFMERRPTQGQWLLEGRTWGHPAAQSVHEWHLLAAQAAHQLDPNVELPERRPGSAPRIPTRPVGAVANRRLARLRRQIVGLR